MRRILPIETRGSGVGPRIGLLLAVAALAGCSRGVKADFPRPPVTAAHPATASAETDTTEEDTVVAPPEQAAATVEPEPAPPPPEHEAPPPPTRPPPEPPAEPEPVEEPSIELAGSPSVDPEVERKLDRAASVLASVARRSLTGDQRLQLSSARGFVAQAERALEDGDARRALVLVDKGLILLDDVDRSSR